MMIVNSYVGLGGFYDPVTTVKITLTYNNAQLEVVSC